MIAHDDLLRHGEKTKGPLTCPIHSASLLPFLVVLILMSFCRRIPRKKALGSPSPREAAATQGQGLGDKGRADGGRKEGQTKSGQGDVA